MAGGVRASPTGALTGDTIYIDGGYHIRG